MIRAVYNIRQSTVVRAISIYLLATSVVMLFSAVYLLKSK